MNYRINKIRNITFILLIVFALSNMTACQKANNKVPDTVVSKPSTTRDAFHEKTQSENYFDWKNGVKTKDILDYLNVPIEERKKEIESISSVFDKGNTIYLKTKSGNHKASISDKRAETVNHYGRALDRRYTYIHGFLFYDTIENREINVTNIVDLKDYETDHVNGLEVDYCQNKVLISCHSKNVNKDMTTWGTYLETAFPTYLLFDLQDYSYEFIKLSKIVYDKNNADTSADAILIDSNKILISYKDRKVSKCKAIIYDLSIKKVIEEYDLDWNFKIAHRIADCVVSPDGKYLLYHESGQTPVELFLYDIEKRKEYNVVDHETEREEIYTFYNWDSENIFFYGVYSIPMAECMVYMRKLDEVR